MNSKFKNRIIKAIQTGINEALNFKAIQNNASNFEQINEKLFGKFETNDQRKRYLSNHYENDSIKSAIWDYTTGYTTSVNNYLRADKEWEDVTNYMDHAFDSKYASYNNIDVFRTVDYDYLNNIHTINKDNIEQYIGKTISNKGYMSCSTKFASPWSKNWCDSELIFHIISNKPIKYLDIDKIFANEELPSGEQYEVILPRDLKMRIKGYDTKFNNKKYNKFSQNGTLIIECEII